MTESRHDHPAPDRAILIWLWIVFAMIFAMVAIGGVTRLTGSGLSMVDWRPVMGILPPLGDEQWQAVFDRYRASPQFEQVNSWMGLAEFKRIFFWEYVHRLFGRLIGFASFLPWLYFSWRGRLPRWLSWRVIAAVGFGGLQGLMGWYMVKSGLVDRPEVSHLRLSAHLLLAIFIAQWILWTLLDLHFPKRDREHHEGTPALHRASLAMLGLVSLQMLYGAWMAGTKAGLLFPSFPDMNGAYLPSPFFLNDSIWTDLVSGPQAIHYVHRSLGWLLLLGGTGLFVALRRSNVPIRPAWLPPALLSILWLQFALGALTALYQVPIVMGVAHQLGAFLLISCSLVIVHQTRGSDPPSSRKPARSNGAPSTTG